MNIDRAKALMTEAAKAAIRGDADAVLKANAALAELERSQQGIPVDGVHVLARQGIA